MLAKLQYQEEIKGSSLLTQPTGENHSEDFVAATEHEVNDAVALANSAFKTYREKSASDRARFLRAIADNILQLDQELVERAIAETGLPEGKNQRRKRKNL